MYGTPALMLRRNDNPVTSFEAAEGVDTNRLEAMVHEGIRDFGGEGCIADDLLNKFSSYSYSSITARFSALERKGLIACGPDKRKGQSGRFQRVMRSL